MAIKCFTYLVISLMLAVLFAGTASDLIYLLNEVQK